MKNFTKKILNCSKIHLLTIALIFSGNTLFGQKVIIVGANYSNGATRNDGVSFVVNTPLVSGNVIYITDYEWIASTQRFGNASALGVVVESILKFTANTSIAKGQVVTLRFASPGTVGNPVPVTVACTGGTCGTAIFTDLNGGINYRTGGESLYAYSDTDDDPTNGVTEVHSVFYPGDELLTNGGGNIPAAESPLAAFPNSVIVDGFTWTGVTELNLIDFIPANRSSNVSKATLENISNYTQTSNPALNPSTVVFASLNLLGTNPTITLATSVASIVENAAGTITFTFTLSANAASNITVNFTVGGTAIFGTDFTQTGAASFNTTSGSITIPSGNNTASFTIDPSPDATLEPNESIIITAVSGTGYDAGSPSNATVTIVNDDTGTSLPKVALVGINQADAGTNPTHIDGFSFVALEDIPSGTVVHFTRRIYDKTALAFTSTYTSTVKWITGTGVNRGDVYTVMETSADVFTVTCSDGSNCGTITNIDASFTIPTGGITMFAYADNNDNPTDGVTEIYSALHTGDLVAFTNGGAIPANSNPASVYPNAVVIDNFPNANPGRTEYKFPTERQVTVTRTLLVNTANWLHAQTTATALSTVRFTNIIVTSGTANPLVTVSASPASVLENSGTGMVYTFTLSQNATSNITINFGVSGTSIFGTDYTQTGATSFTTTTGSITIASGSNTATVTLTPVAETTLEPNETIILTINTGTGYDAGSPNVATGTITNDDIKNVNNLVVIIGINHGGNATEPDGFSFAANQNITAGTDIYFVDGLFNNTSLSFGTLEAVVKYTVPTGGLGKGQVVYIVETGQTTNTFSVSCSAGSNCGTATYITQANPTDFSCAISGDNLYAYTDTDGDPTNGITGVHSLFYAINNAIPSLENPTTVFPNAVVVSGFGSSAPNRTEYKFAASERSAPINLANIQNTANYLIAQTAQNLSVIPFTGLSLCPATITGQPAAAIVCVGTNTLFIVTATGTNLTYQWQVNTGTGFTNITNTGIYSGATTTTLSLTVVPIANNGFTYRCVVNDCATSNTVALTVNVLPTITLGSIPSICAGATSFTIPYTATTNSPTTYSISGTGFTTVTDAVLPATPITVVLSAAAVFGTNPTYNLTVKNANGCISTNAAGTITVNASTLPTTAQTATQSISNNFIAATGCAIIANVLPNGAAPVNGSVTAKVWVETTQPVQFVKRHYEINPATNAANATARVTLYFNDAEFNSFNTQTTPPALLLPVSTDAPATITARKANLRIEKRAGTGDANGTLNSYTSTITTIDPVDADIIWNASASRWEVSFDVAGFSGFWLKTQLGVLPLNLVSFTGTKTGNGILLEWKTANEINTKAFTIERSNDGINFIGTGNVNALGNGNGNYNFTDADKYNGVVYYRLKMIDNDGRFTKSNIIKLSNQPINQSTIFPNPIKDKATLQIGDRTLLNTQATIIDANGRIIRTFIIKNNFEIVDMSGTANGLYLLKMINGEMLKMIKQ